MKVVLKFSQNNLLINALRTLVNKTIFLIVKRLSNLEII